MFRLPLIRHISPRVVRTRLHQSILLAPRRPFATKPPPPGVYPSPPRLPPEEQSEFERLQKEAMEKLSAQPLSAEQSQTRAPKAAANAKEEDSFFKRAEPEFEGDVNPKTGEAGGPKTEPLRWGEGGDWSYNGKVTDF